MERRLAAILAADVVGYTSLMGEDEAGTLERLTGLRQHVLEPLIADHGGRIVKLMGDGMLVEFASVVGAVSCAVAWQDGVAKDNVVAEDASALRFRIGINLGDVIVEGDDIFGDGVNLAARLEGLAEPGGICLSDDAYRQAKGKVAAEFEDLGEQSLKNVAEPVRVCKFVTKETASQDFSAGTATLPLPDKPSLAVLPFQNLSGDPGQEYFADGITEDIITALSRINWFFVIARNSTFTYKDRRVDVQQVGRELGVRYVLEGSVRKAGNRIRITALLVDGETRKHIWAEKYDRELEDVFDVQDEITENIAGALEPQLAVAEGVRARRKSSRNLDAWDLVIQAMAKIGEFSESGSREALDLLDRAVEIDPTYAKAHSQKAWTTAWRTNQGWEDAASAIPAATDAANRALRIDPDDPWAYIALLFVAANKHDGPGMLSAASKAIELNPNFALAYSFLGAAHALTGNGAQSFELIEKARRLSPRDTFRIEFDVHTCMAYFQIGDYQNAALFAAKALEPKPDHLYPHFMLAASYAHLGSLEEAQAEISKITELLPGCSLTLAGERCVYATENERARFVDGLRKAGMPE